MEEAQKIEIKEPKALTPISVEGESWKPTIRTFEDQQRLAKMYLASKVLPIRFKTEAEIITALHFASEHFPGKELTALRQIAVIQGSPVLFGDLPLALVQRSGKLESMVETFEDAPGQEKATCTVKRFGLEAITRSFSMSDARRAGLSESQTYKKYPLRMLQCRARSWALKDGFADILAGIGILEYEFNKAPEELDVTESKLDKFKSLSAVHSDEANGGVETSVEAPLT